MIGIILFYADELYLIYTGMNSSCNLFYGFDDWNNSFYADNMQLIYADMEIPLDSYYAGSIIDIVLFY